MKELEIQANLAAILTIVFNLKLLNISIAVQANQIQTLLWPK